MRSHIWKINGVPIMGPDSVAYQERATVGIRVDGAPVRQGLRAIELRYGFLAAEDYTQLHTLWTSANGLGANLTYVDAIGNTVTSVWKMSKPVAAGQSTFFYQGVTVRFTPWYRGLSALQPFPALSGTDFASAGRFSDSTIRLSRLGSSSVFGIPILTQLARHVINFEELAASTEYGEFTISASGSFGTQISEDILLYDNQPSSLVGPFLVGTDLYVLARVSSGTLSPCMWKSSDAGATWAEVDDGNRPSAGSTSDSLLVASAILDGTDIIVAFRYEANGIKIVVFDTITDLWDTPSAALTVSGLSTGLGIGARSDGTYVVLFRWISSGFQRASYAILSSGTWSSATDITTLTYGSSADYRAIGLIVDSADKTHFFWHETNGSSPRIRYRTLTLAGTLSSVTSISTSSVHSSALCTQPIIYNDGVDDIVAILFTRYSTAQSLGYAESIIGSGSWSVTSAAAYPEVAAGSNFDVQSASVTYVNGFLVDVFYDAYDDVYYYGKASGIWEVTGQLDENSGTLWGTSIFPVSADSAGIVYLNTSVLYRELTP